MLCVSQMSGSEDNTVRIWNAVSGDMERTLVGHSGSVDFVAFSSDGTRVVLACAGGTSLTISHDGIRVVSGSDEELV